MARRAHGPGFPGYTLVEMLIATTLTLMMMGAVATLFGTIGESVSSARATIEMSDALRGAASRLRADLDGVAVPVAPGTYNGYFEYVEGPVGPVVTPGYVARNTDAPRTPSGASDPDQILFEQDSTAGDTDDNLMFTTHAPSNVEAFVGRYNGTAYIESRDAEVAWFVRGRTLYRRQLVIAPAGTAIDAVSPYYARNDISVHRDSGGALALNSLTDDTTLKNGLARPENRFAHQSGPVAAGSFPYHPHRVTGWAQSLTSSTTPPTHALARLNLPLLQECSDPAWNAAGLLPQIGTTAPLTAALNAKVRSSSDSASDVPLPFDAWLNPHPWERDPVGDPVVDRVTGVLINVGTGEPLGVSGQRFGEDIILNNVLTFDVKAWDPGAPVISMTRTQAGVTDVSLVLPGDSPRPAATNDPDAAQYTGYAQAVARVGTNPTDNNATPPITYSYTFVGTGAYVDLGYGTNPPISNATLSTFSGDGRYAATMPRVYDTWSSHYETNLDINGVGIDDDGDGIPNQAVDGIDNGPAPNPNGQIDDSTEREAPPPYDVPLRGIQIKIRVYEPDTRQIREITIVRNFATYP